MVGKRVVSCGLWVGGRDQEIAPTGRSWWSRSGDRSYREKCETLSCKELLKQVCEFIIVSSEFKDAFDFVFTVGFRL